MVAPVGAHVNPGEDDLLMPSSQSCLHVVQDLLQRSAALRAACLVDDAVGAGIVAAVLDLDKGPDPSARLWFSCYLILEGKLARDPVCHVILGPVADYLAPQRRFRHLGDEEIAYIQKRVDADWDHLKALVKATNPEPEGEEEAEAKD